METQSNIEKRIHQATHLISTLQVDIVSAEQAIYSGRAKMVTVTGSEGELGILPGHAQLLTSLHPGQIRIITTSNTEDIYYISGGFLEVQPDAVNILADTVIRAADLDEQLALAVKTKAEQTLAHKGLKSIDYAAALAELAKAIAQLKIIRRANHK